MRFEIVTVRISFDFDLPFQQIQKNVSIQKIKVQHNFASSFSFDVYCVVGCVESFFEGSPNLPNWNTDVVEHLVFIGFYAHVIERLCVVPGTKNYQSLFCGSNRTLHDCQCIDEEALCLVLF